MDATMFLRKKDATILIQSFPAAEGDEPWYVFEVFADGNMVSLHLTDTQLRCLPDVVAHAIEKERAIGTSETPQLLFQGHLTGPKWGG